MPNTEKVMPYDRAVAEKQPSTAACVETTAHKTECIFHCVTIYQAFEMRESDFKLYMRVCLRHEYVSKPPNPHLS